jgi:hypothetical protein
LRSRLRRSPTLSTALSTVESYQDGHRRATKNHYRNRDPAAEGGNPL